MNNDVYTREVDSRGELLPRIFGAAVRVNIKPDENHAIFARELQIALSLAVKYGKLLCEM